MKPHSIVLRSGCILPGRLDLLQRPFREDRALVDEIPALVFATMIRHAGLHFVLVRKAHFRGGIGRTKQSSMQRCVVWDLQGVSRRFNAAELIPCRGTRCPGFFVAQITVRARQTQLCASLDTVKQLQPLAMRAPAMPDNALDKGNAPKIAAAQSIHIAPCTPCVKTESR